MVGQDYGKTHQLGEVEGISKKWGWFLALGILLVLLGAAAISTAFYSTIFTMIILGFFLLCGGVVQIFQAVLARKWSGFFLALLLGILYIITGFISISKPAEAAVGLTLLIAVLCFVGGLFRMITSLVLRFEYWGWVFFNGLVTFILGILIYSEWPISGLWVIGLFVGIDLILAGWSWILLALSAQNRLLSWK